MTKFLFANIQRESLHIPKLEVHSYEMNIYLVKLFIDEKSGFVYNEDDTPMRFNSSQHIRHAFEHCTVDSAYMVHDTPYDEMIGNPKKAAIPMALPFSMTLPY